jgi:hypothetical protein
VRRHRIRPRIDAEELRPATARALQAEHDQRTKALIERVEQLTREKENPPLEAQKKIQALVPALSGMVKGGLLTVEPVKVLRRLD